MKKCKILFLGSRPLAAKIIEYLLTMEGVSIVGCVVKEPSLSAWWEQDPFYVKNVKVLTWEQAKTIDFDLGVSVNFWKKIPKEIIDKTNLGIVNVHHSFNLELRGRDMTSRAILQASKGKMLCHGTTLHYIDEDLDSGRIIESRSIPIDNIDTSWSLFNKTERCAEQLLKEWLPRLILSVPTTVWPSDDRPVYLRNGENGELSSLKNILYTDLLTIKSFDIVRAFDFNNHFEPAYTVIDNKKVYLTTQNSGNELVVSYDTTKKIYKSTFEK
jgi:methionyl-tRNA formyltransferase